MANELLHNADGKLMYLRHRLRKPHGGALYYELDDEGTYLFPAGAVDHLLCRGALPKDIWANGVLGGRANEDDAYQSYGNNVSVGALPPTDAAQRAIAIADLMSVPGGSGMLRPFVASMWSANPAAPSIGYGLWVAASGSELSATWVPQWFGGAPIVKAWVAAQNQAGSDGISATNPLRVALLQTDDDLVDILAAHTPSALDQITDYWDITSEGGHSLDISELGFTMTDAADIWAVFWHADFLPTAKGYNFSVQARLLDYAFTLADPP